MIVAAPPGGAEPLAPRRAYFSGTFSSDETE